MSISKYENLTFYLAGLDKNELTIPFSKIEEILYFPLPDSAYKYNAWWANQSGSGHSQSSAWQRAGWKTRDIDLQSQRVTFYYDGGFESSDTSIPDEKELNPKALTIAQAKSGLSVQFGVPEEAIEIHIRG